MSSFSYKVNYYSKIVDTVIDRFSTYDESRHLNIYDHSINTFGIGEKCMGFSNTYHVDSSERFIRSIVDKVNSDIYILQNVLIQKKMI